VREAEFRSLVAQAGLRIVEEKMFHTGLKNVYKVLPVEQQAGFMRRWLEFELYLNTLGLTYRDDLALLFRTRNFILRHNFPQDLFP
jgi:hypothetical protein